MNLRLLAQTTLLLIALTVGNGFAQDGGRGTDLIAEAFTIETADGKAGRDLVRPAQAQDGAEHIVSQTDKLFVPDALAIKAGDTVRFVNADSVSHNVFCHSDEFKFTTGSQSPGENAGVVFIAAGRFIVRCAVHPKMRLLVTVE